MKHRVSTIGILMAFFITIMFIFVSGMVHEIAHEEIYKYVCGCEETEIFMEDMNLKTTCIDSDFYPNEECVQYHMRNEIENRNNSPFQAFVVFSLSFLVVYLVEK